MGSFGVEMPIEMEGHSTSPTTKEAAAAAAAAEAAAAAFMLAAKRHTATCICRG